jgi:thioredoxin-dependent peroxiredoxin
LADLESARAQFESHNTAVMAINHASMESHAEYCNSKGFGFPILSDPDKRIIDLFGCRNWLTGGVSRAVFAVDTNGRVIFAEPGRASFADALTAIQNSEG